MRWQEGGMVFLGAGLGGVCRWAATLALSSWLGAAHWATLGVNGLGALGIGFLFARLEDPSPLRLLTITGFLGGFTTFSAFSIETVRLIEQKDFRVAAVLAVGSVALCVSSAGLGYALSRMVSRA